MQLGNFKKQIILGLLGLILLSGGVLYLRLNQTKQTSPEVEIIKKETKTNNASEGDVVVEIVGAVVSPGVYTLKSGSRVEDLINASGGLTSQADGIIIEKTINRAAIIKDSQKVYIPKFGEVNVSPQVGSEVLSSEASQPQTGLVNINTASQSQLESLWGIGPVIAQNIIEQRPYSSTEELLNKKIVKSNVYDRIKSQISVY